MNTYSYPTWAIQEHLCKLFNEFLPNKDQKWYLILVGDLPFYDCEDLAIF